MKLAEARDYIRNKFTDEELKEQSILLYRNQHLCNITDLFKVETITINEFHERIDTIRLEYPNSIVECDDGDFSGAEIEFFDVVEDRMETITETISRLALAHRNKVNNLLARRTEAQRAVDDAFATQQQEIAELERLKQKYEKDSV